MSGLGSPIEALKRPLAFAAREGFAHLDKVRDLGATLRANADRLLAVLGEAAAHPLDEWRRALDGFDQAPRRERELLVARGLRLVATLGGAAAAGRPPVSPARPGGKPRPAGAWNDPAGVLPGCGPGWPRSWASEASGRSATCSGWCRGGSKTGGRCARYA